MSTPDAGYDAEYDVERELESGLDGESGRGSAAPEVTIAFSPRQILGGFALLAALLAALLVLIFRRRKR
jgi:hypothetical protein